MRKIAKSRALLGTLIAVLALMVLAVVPAMAQVPVFSPFSGSLIIDAADAPVGSELRAYVDGVQAELLAPAVDDVFTLTTAGEYQIVIETDATGQAVTFEVKKAGTTAWLAATSDPANPVTSYQPQVVDLVAGGVAPGAPTVVTNAATNIGTTTARTNGNLTDLGTASTVACYFELGQTTAYGDTCGPINMSATGSFYCNWSGLSPNTTYHFRAMAVGDGTSYGSDMTFTTQEGPPPPPTGSFAWWLYEEFIEPLMD